MKVILEHHYGKREYENSGETLYESAYKAIRETHHFLTDDNHAHRLSATGSGVAIFYNENSPRPYPNPFTDGSPGSFWFSVQYFSKKETP